MSFEPEFVLLFPFERFLQGCQVHSSPRIAEDSHDSEQDAEATEVAEDAEIHEDTEVAEDVGQSELLHEAAWEWLNSLDASVRTGLYSIGSRCGRKSRLCVKYRLAASQLEFCHCPELLSLP